MVSRGFPVVYARDVESVARFWELLGLERHYQLPADGAPGYVGLRAASFELAVTNRDWALDRYGLKMAEGPRFEMYLYVGDLDDLLRHLRDAGVRVLRDPEAMPWGERIATVADPEGNPVVLCAERERSCDCRP